MVVYIKFDKYECSKAWPGLPQRTRMVGFATIVNVWKMLTIIAKLSILDVCVSPGYVFGIYAYFEIWLGKH